MRILLVMDPGIAVPPAGYGGHERLVYLFAEEYTRMGHHVTILAGPDSYCSGKTVTFGINDLNRSWLQRMKEVLFAWRFLYRSRKDFDLVHNFGRLIYLLPILNHPVNKIMTYGRPVAQKGVRFVNALPNQKLVFTACSHYCVSTGNVAGRWETVYNAIDFSQYRLNEKIDENAPLMFLGRLDKVKGVHTAIAVAKATGHQLIIGGNVSHTPDNYAYFKQEIEPHLDNEQIIYHGPMDDEAKNNYLGRARALLFPIEWDEPFGMVMIEAMACGTPVIAFNRGSVPEVVCEESGFRVRDAAGMEAAVGQIGHVNRKACRESAERRFDVAVIAAQYLTIINQP